MGNSAKKATLEDLQEIIRDIGKSQQKTEESLREVTEAHKETEAAQQKTEESLREVAEEQKKTEAAQQKTEAAQQKTEALTQETRVFLKDLGKKIDKVNRDLGKKIDKVNGNLTNKWGKFVENLVHGDLLNLLAPWDIEVDRVQPRLVYTKFGENPGGEFDLVAVNSKELVIIEVKSTLDKGDIYRFIKKLQAFSKIPSTEYKDKIIYGGVAYLEVIKHADELAYEKGLFIIKAPGGECKISTITNEKGFKPTEF